MKTRHLSIILTILALAIPQHALATPLDDYVAAPDSNYSYSVINTLTGPGYKAYVINMTSQSWRKPGEVDRTLWQHWLTIIKPDAATANTALLWITGGNNGSPAPTSADPMIVGIALGANTVVAELRMVPNQPLIFPDGGGPRYEDAIIAYSFNKCLETNDPNWPALFPMAKSAVRAMDTIQKHISSPAAGNLKIDQFVVSGASKRGWTTWLTAAVDHRVIAIAPVVIDVLNMAEQMKHHYSAYGFYSPSIHDYVQYKIFDRLNTPAGRQLRTFVDPYEYRSRYTMPKYGINSSGDQFFLPDSAQFYFKDMLGEKYLRYVPNTDHGLGGSDAPLSLLTFYKSILAGSQRPKFSWSVAEDGAITVQTTTAPTAVNLWQATNPNARDFRLETIGPVWKSSPLEKQPDGTYVAKVTKPEKGWTAYFIEMTFDSGGPIPYKFTTEVRVVPDLLPFAYKLGFDTDCDIDFDDLTILAVHWLSGEPCVDVAPICGDGHVNFLDYALFAAEWRYGKEFTTLN